ncbi:MAG TPA: hypothetical protein VFL73_08045 [Solirubrobacteraceae bacterium]|nr:hypothetical protein [Solirubrobacteraceae bacterium]
MDRAALAAAVPLVDAFAARREAVTSRTLDFVERDLVAFDGWYSDRLVADMAGLVASRVLAGQETVGQLTDAYLSRMTSLVAGQDISPVGVSAALAKSLRIGVAALPEAYGRLGPDYRWRRSQGVDAVEAQAATVTRAKVMADEDLGLAFQRQVVDFNQRRGVLRYRRVVRSERPCGLCFAASDRLYTKSDLLPLHARCRCGVITVTHQTDPGSTLTNDDLPALYEFAGGTSAAQLKRVVVVQHGELGPQLRVAGQHFRGPDEVAA